jgi:hypothetical protein
MKKIIFLALLLTSFTAAQAQTNNTSIASKENKDTVKPSAGSKIKAIPAAPAAKPTAAASDDSAHFVGTNDFYLVLVREGMRKG